MRLTNKWRMSAVASAAMRMGFRPEPIRLHRSTTPSLTVTFKSPMSYRPLRVEIPQEHVVRVNQVRSADNTDQLRVPDDLPISAPLHQAAFAENADQLAKLANNRS